ncbi:MAG: hypothetical protein IPK19_33485 [Chloroflexi bacterium]|nr:hypothetical protein [Chloroflexota bacterium]
MRRIAVLMGILLILSGQPAAAQEGSGALVIDSASLPDISVLYPRLFAVDEMGRLMPATVANGGLIESWTVEFGDFSPDNDLSQSETRVVFMLREDAFWADGTRVNAYDVFRSIEQNWRRFGDGLRIAEWSFVVPVSEESLVMVYEGDSCSALEAQGNSTITAADRSGPWTVDLRNLMMSDGDSLDQRYEEARSLIYGSPDMNSADQFQAVSAQHQYVERTDDHERYRIGDLALTVETSRFGDRLDEVNDFISGELDVIVNPPYVYRSDLRAVPDIQIVEQVGRTWYALGFNFVDSSEPLDAFDEKTGEPQEQRAHPFFSHLKVREAVRLALDINALGAAATAGHYTPLASDQLPWSWAYNPDIPMPEYDPFDAAQILEGLGWRDWDGDGVRECQGCATAETGQPLWFSLTYDEDDLQQIIVARGIQEQLARIGVGVEFWPYYGSASILGAVAGQTFDAYLLRITERSPVAADRALLYRQSEDRLNSGVNVTSYVNPEMEAVFDRAAHAPDCDYDARAEGLSEASALIYEDIPYLPLFAGNDFYAAQGWVGGFAPRQNDPFWNMADWVVNR